MLVVLVIRLARYRTLLDCKSFIVTTTTILIKIDICKAPTLRLKALNKHSITHIMYIEMENVMSNLVFFYRFYFFACYSCVA